MSIRMLAVELYRAKREEGELEKEIENLPANSPEKEGLRRRLQEAKARSNWLKALLDGAKHG
jgi:hypothetical protein